MAQTRGFTEFTGIGCKFPGGSGPFTKGYAYQLITRNTTDRRLLVVVTAFSVAGVPAPDYVEILAFPPACGDALTCATYENPPQLQQDGSVTSVCVPPDSSVDWIAVAAEYSNSQNDSAFIAFDVYDITDGTCVYIASGQDSTNPNDLPPCDDETRLPI